MLFGSLTVALLLHLSCAVRSKCESMDVAAGNTQLMLMHHRVPVWFEDVESEANRTTALPEKPHGTCSVCRMVSHIGKFHARRGFGGSRSVPHLNFVPSVVCSCLEMARNQKTSALTTDTNTSFLCEMHSGRLLPDTDVSRRDGYFQKMFQYWFVFGTVFHSFQFHIN